MYVQGASLKTYAVVAWRLSNSPITRKGVLELKLSEVSIETLRAWADAGVMDMKTYVEEVQRRQAETHTKPVTAKS